MKANLFQMLHFLKNFILCGSYGWCMECFWSGINAIREKKDRFLTCHTSVWMFPIYGMAAVLSPLCNLLKNRSTIFRGTIYTLLIYLGEWCSGSILRKYKSCPWDYSNTRFNYKGLVRLDYAPAWFFSGLIFEKILQRSK